MIRFNPPLTSLLRHTHKCMWVLVLGNNQTSFRCHRRIIGPKRNEVTGEWRKLHNEELNDLYSSTNIVQVVKLRQIMWAGHVPCMGEISGV